MIIIFFTLIFTLGLIVGSFLNVLIYRLPRNLQFIKGRSFCPNCKKRINLYDNIPLLSFILLRGKCRNCGKKISLRYPLVELITGGIFLLSYLSHLSFLSYLLISGLIVIFFIDFDFQIIPDEIIFPLIVLYLLRFVLNLFISHLTTNYLLLTTYSPLFSAFGSFLFFYLIYILTKKKGMGFGDVKLAFLMGLVLDFPKIIVAFYISFLTGAFAGIILILVGKARLKQKIAFGPFLTFSTIISLLWGEKIVEILGKILF